MELKTQKQAVATRKGITNVLVLFFFFFTVEKLWVLGFVRHQRIRVGIVMKNYSNEE